jgi:phosphotriesterase-related protein
MNPSIHIPITVLYLLLASCKPAAEKGIITVLGPLPAGEMGITLAHEHILVDFIGADSTGPHRWNKQEVVERVTPYLKEARDHGCRTFIDCSPTFLGKDPVLLRMLAEKTGLNIITNTGWYGAMDDLFIPAFGHQMSAEEIAEVWIAEYRDGIEGTPVRPGFIKIGVDRSDTLSLMDEKLIRAAGIAHLETGLVIKSHTGPDAPAFEQLEILREMGVPPEAFIWTHAQAGTHEGRIKAARAGAWISMDNVNEKNAVQYLTDIQGLKAENCLHRLIISHDAGWYSPGQSNGGNFRPYSAIFTHLIPLLRDNGFTEEEIHGILVMNPAAAFATEEL